MRRMEWRVVWATQNETSSQRRFCRIFLLDFYHSFWEWTRHHRSTILYVWGCWINESWKRGARRGGGMRQRLFVCDVLQKPVTIETTGLNQEGWKNGWWIFQRDYDDDGKFERNLIFVYEMEKGCEMVMHIILVWIVPSSCFVAFRKIQSLNIANFLHSILLLRMWKLMQF